MLHGLLIGCLVLFSSITNATNSTGVVGDGREITITIPAEKSAGTEINIAAQEQNSAQHQNNMQNIQEYGAQDAGTPLADDIKSSHDDSANMQDYQRNTQDMHRQQNLVDFPQVITEQPNIPYDCQANPDQHNINNWDDVSDLRKRTCEFLLYKECCSKSNKK